MVTFINMNLRFFGVCLVTLEKIKRSINFYQSLRRHQRTQPYHFPALPCLSSTWHMEEEGKKGSIIDYHKVLFRSKQFFVFIVAETWMKNYFSRED